MLRNASAIKGYAIAATDGRLGTVSDFLFDDASWLVRWLVVDTGKWLSGRKVLLPPSVLGHIDPNGNEFAVSLTMQQVKDSPDIDTERPVSRQIETNIYDFYGWSPYWGGTGFLMGGWVATGVTGTAMAAAPSRPYRPPDLCGAQRILPRRSKATTIRISAASKRSPGIISTPATARSVTSRTSSCKIPIGASIISSSTRRTGGRAKRF